MTVVEWYPSLSMYRLTSDTGHHLQWIESVTMRDVGFGNDIRGTRILRFAAAEPEWIRIERSAQSASAWIDSKTGKHVRFARYVSFLEGNEVLASDVEYYGCYEVTVTRTGGVDATSTFVIDAPHPAPSAELALFRAFEDLGWRSCLVRPGDVRGFMRLAQSDTSAA